MKKLVLFVITSLLFTFLYLSVQNTYSLFTKKIDKTGNINTIKSEATFLPGPDFNVKIKTLAGDNNPATTTSNNNIISIVRADKLTINPTSDNIVSDGNSLMPIYAWFNNGTLYYYSEANTLYMNARGNSMFAHLEKMTNIDLSNIDTSRTTSMFDLFAYNHKLESIDVSNFVTNSVTTMQGMFFQDFVLTSVDVSGFNTSNVENMAYMFSECNKINVLDISNFDMTKVGNTSSSFYIPNLKEFKTPKIYPNDTSKKITLYKTMYDENMVEYTSLGKSTSPSSPTESWLKEGYTVNFDANGGTVSPTSKVVRRDGTYGQLPTPTKNGYTFKGWNGRNLLNYSKVTDFAVSQGINVDLDGNISDISPTSDTRTWNYNGANWHFTLSGGTYTLTILFSQQATNEGALSYSNLVLSDRSGNIFTGQDGCLSNINSYSRTFSITGTKELGLLVKAYDGVYKIQIEKNSSYTSYEPYYIVSSTHVVQEQNHILKAIWEANKYNLTINPNGGVYNNTTSNTVVEQDMDSVYGLSVPTREGYDFLGWTLTNNGTLLNGDPSGNPSSVSATSFLVETLNTESNGSQFTNFSFENVEISSITWPHILYSRYPFEVNHTYRISFDVRLNTRIQSSLYFDHGANFNDWNTPGATGISVLEVTGEWKRYTMDRIFTATQLENSSTGEMVTVSPLLDIIVTVYPNTSSSLDFDVRNITIEDVTSGTYISNGTFSGYIYKYGAGAGTLTAQWQKKQYTINFNDNGATSNNHTTSITFEHGDSLPNITVPTKDGYIFKGYSSGSNSKDLIYNLQVISSNERRINLIDEENGWSLNNSDLGSHISAKITMDASPRYLQFNDINITQYEVIENNSKYDVYLDFDIESSMLQTTPYNYLASYRFIDFPSDVSITDIKIEYIVKDGKKFYDYSGKSVLETDFNENITLYANWVKIDTKNCDGNALICINNLSDLQTLKDEVNSGDNKKGKYYILSNDIDMGGAFDSDGTMLSGSTNWAGIGDYTNNKPFSGTFDGNGHIIKKLYINTDSQYVSLFNYTVGATIKNIGIEDSYVINTTYGAAALVNVLKNSTLDSCYNKATVKGNKTTAGLVALSNNSTISNSYNTGTVDNGTYEFGAGIVGYNNPTTLVKNCYNSGNISGGIEVAGIVGGNHGSLVTNTYNLGTIDASYPGGVVGQLWKNGQIENSYNSGNILVNGVKNTSVGAGIVYKILTDTNQELSNNHYLDTTADYGIILSDNSNYSSNYNLDASSLTSSQMPSVLSVINGDNAFISDEYNINNGYPLLKWEKTLGRIVYYDPVNTNTIKKCDSTTFNLTNVNNGTSTCYKWRIITVNKNNNTLNIQLDHNLVAINNWNTSGDTNDGPSSLLSTLLSATLSWKRHTLNYTYDSSISSPNNYGTLSCTNGICTISKTGETIGTSSSPLRARIITGEEVAAITRTQTDGTTIADKWPSTSKDWFFASSMDHIIGTHTSGTGNNVLSWLIENTMNSNQQSGSTDNIYGSNSTGYWTLTPVYSKSEYMFSVLYRGDLGYNVSGNYGIRPVLSVNKNELRY